MDRTSLPQDFKDFLKLLIYIEDSIDGIKIKIIDLENLKKNKKASGRFKDLDDIENLP